MKKITLFVAAVAVLASCNREDALATQGGGSAENGGNLNVKNFEQSELQNMITPMSQAFGFNGKGAVRQMSYMYRAWAEPVQLNLTLSGIEGTATLAKVNASDPAFVNLSATAAWSVNDMVFVVWHASEFASTNSTSYNVNTGGSLLGGAITAYKQSGIGQYEFMDRVDFYDTDYHELYGDVNDGSGNYEIMMAGQRSVVTSGYLLANHNGAVITRIDYDYINDEFWEGSFRELPLPGTSANDVVGAARRFYVTTGGSGGSTGTDLRGAVYEVDRNLVNINRGENLTDEYSGRSIAIDNQIKVSGSENVDALFVLSTKGEDVQLHEEVVEFTIGTNSTNFALSTPAVAASTPDAHNLLERADITIASSDDNPFTAGVVAIPRSDDRTFITLPYVNTGGSANGSVFKITGPSSLSAIPNVGNAISTEYDAGLDVLYVAMGGNGTGPGKALAVKALALSEHATQSPLINEYDVVGVFAPPTIGSQTVSFVTAGVAYSMTPTINDVKEITIYGSRNITLAAGNQGVFFIQRDKY